MLCGLILVIEWIGHVEHFQATFGAIVDSSAGAVDQDVIRQQC